MDWACKATLTAVMVAAVMMAVRLCGRSAAGMLAGCPVISAPALLWLAEEQGAAFSAASAEGSLTACVAALCFAAAYERSARRHGAVTALGVGCLVLAGALWLLQGLQGHPVLALVMVAAAGVLLHRDLQALPVDAGRVRPLRGEPWLTAAMAGSVSALIALMAQWLGAFWAGMLAALPLVSACAMVHLRRAGAAGDVRGFVAGYVPGILAKGLFLFVFAQAAPRLGALVALGLALAAGAAGAAWLHLGGRGRAPQRRQADAGVQHGR